MKTLLLTTTLASIILGAALPVAAMSTASGLFDATVTMADHDRRKPRVPGGSGCDDPGDIKEHPECRPVTR